MRPWPVVPLLALAFAGCLGGSGNTPSAVEGDFPLQRSEGCTPESLDSFAARMEPLVARASARLDNETRDLPSDASATVAVESLRVLYEVQDSYRRHYAPEQLRVTFREGEWARLDLGEPSRVLLPNAYGCGYEYEFRYALVFFGSVEVFLCDGPNECGPVASARSFEPLEEAARAAFPDGTAAPDEP